MGREEIRLFTSLLGQWKGGESRDSRWVEEEEVGWGGTVSADVAIFWMPRSYGNVLGEICGSG